MRRLLFTLNLMWRWLDGQTPQCMFVLVACIFGTACAFITPPIQVPDEPNHWYRVYQLSQGQVLGVREISPGKYEYGGMIPLSIARCCSAFENLPGHRNAHVSPGVIEGEFHRPLKAAETGLYLFPNTALYSPVPYLPAAMLMAIARKLELPPIALLYFGRMGTLIGVIGLGWLAIRTSPILKWPMAMILACPMCLFLAGSVSADAITIGLVFFAIAVVMRFALQAGDLTWRSIVGLACLMVAVALSKSAYCPVAMMVFAIPAGKWKRARWIGPVSIVLLSIGAVGLWSGVTHPQHVREAGDDPSQQLAWVMHHGPAFVEICVHTLSRQAGALIYSSVGVLGWLDTPMPVALIQIFMLGLVWLCVAYGEPIELGVWPRVLAAGAVGVSVGMIVLANYLVWNRIGAREIAGLQGRYFLPLFGLGCLVLHRGGGYVVRGAWAGLGMVLVGGLTGWVLLGRYFVG